MSGERVSEEVERHKFASTESLSFNISLKKGGKEATRDIPQVLRLTLAAHSDFEHFFLARRAFHGSGGAAGALSIRRRKRRADDGWEEEKAIE